MKHERLLYYVGQLDTPGVLWAGSRTTGGKITSGLHNPLSYCVTCTVHHSLIHCLATRPQHLAQPDRYAVRDLAQPDRYAVTASCTARSPRSQRFCTARSPRSQRSCTARSLRSQRSCTARPLRSQSQCLFLQFPASSRFLRSSSTCLRLLPSLPVTSILPSIFPSITCFRRQFLRKVWPIQLTFLMFIVYGILILSLTSVTLLHFSNDRSNQSFPSLYSTKSEKFAGIFEWLSQLSQFQHLHTAVLQMQHSTSFFLKFKPNLLAQTVFFMVHVARTVATLRSIPRVHFAAFVTLLLKQLTYSTFLHVLLTMHPNTMKVFFLFCWPRILIQWVFFLFYWQYILIQWKSFSCFVDSAS